MPPFNFDDEETGFGAGDMIFDDESEGFSGEYDGSGEGSFEFPQPVASCPWAMMMNNPWTVIIIIGLIGLVGGMVLFGFASWACRRLTKLRIARSKLRIARRVGEDVERLDYCDSSRARLLPQSHAA